MHSDDNTLLWPLLHLASQSAQYGFWWASWNRSHQSRLALALLQLPDLLFDFLRPLGVVLLLVRGEFFEQPEKLTSMHALLVGYVLQHFGGQLAVDGLGQLHVHLDRLVLRRHQEPYGPDQFLSLARSENGEPNSGIVAPP